ncbi:MAG: hypothetical protein ACI9FR_000360 [Cryomorphaceae bacterium]|jgi:hypothetical protein
MMVELNPAIFTLLMVTLMSFEPVCLAVQHNIFGVRMLQYRMI